LLQVGATGGEEEEEEEEENVFCDQLLAGYNN
jgi:hypothetical protein